MQTMYLIVFSLLGGIISLFTLAGWSSFSTKKLPDMNMMFRTFVAGVIGVGLATYAWLFGFQGDPTKLMEQVSDVLEVKETLESLTQVNVSDSNNNDEEIKVGMPNF